MPEQDAGWTSIGDHGLIGDLRTSALVATDGTIDWFCVPRFDSPSVFGSVLDRDEGGAWSLSPVGGATRTQQFYLPDSAVLATRFLTPDGVVEVHDFMPVLKSADPDHRQRLVRRVMAVRGTVKVRMSLDARPDYGRERCVAEEVDLGVMLTGDGVRMGLSATADLHVKDGVVTSEVELESGESALFILEVLAGDEEFRDGSTDNTSALFDTTTAFWRGWLSQSTYTGRWREIVNRSAITLKLLTHEPSGALIAAPTTSLPEEIGGSRNWDYRYVWMRDAAFSLYALLRLGFTQEASAFVRWLCERLGEERDGDQDHGLGPLRVLYDIDGNQPVDEHELDHRSGHLDSKPVRVGHAALDQQQHAAEMFERMHPNSGPTRTHCSSLAILSAHSRHGELDREA